MFEKIKTEVHAIVIPVLDSLMRNLDDNDMMGWFKTLELDSPTEDQINKSELIFMEFKNNNWETESLVRIIIKQSIVKSRMSQIISFIVFQNFSMLN